MQSLSSCVSVCLLESRTVYKVADEIYEIL